MGNCPKSLIHRDSHCLPKSLTPL